MKKLLSVKIILTGCFFLFSVSLFAQDTTHLADNQIYWKWPHYKMDGRRLRGKEFADEMYKVPQAIPYYKKAMKNRTIGSLLVVPITIAAFLIKEPSGAYYVSTKTNSLYYGSIIVASGGLIYCFLRSKKYFKKAISIHNKKMAVTY